MHPIGIVRVSHFEFICRTMHIDPMVTRFRVFHQVHCSQGFYSFVQRAFAKKILLQPPKSFHDWGKEDVPTETIQTPFSENWYQDLKDVPSIALPEKALVGASMSLSWRMNREEKPVYMEDGNVVSLYVVAFEREGGKMATIPKKPDEELWYHRIAMNFVFPRDEDLTAQPSSGKRCAPTAAIAPKKNDADKAQSSKAKNVRGETKGIRHSSDFWCNYVVVSDSLEGLAPAVMRRPKSEPRDTADIHPSNPDDPIDLESSPEYLLRKKAGKRKQTDTEAEGQPVKKVQKKKITRRGNLDAFISKPVIGMCFSLFSFHARWMFVTYIVSAEKPSSPVPAEPSSVVYEDLPPSPPRAPISEQLESTEAADNEAEKTAEAWNPEVENPADVAVNLEKVNSSEAEDADVGHLQSPVFVA
ncbi:hypothetical protein Hanom_Chr09g00829421 [Helianthus anomalus]